MFEQLEKHIRKFVPILDSELKTLTEFFHVKQLRKKDYLFRQNEVCRYIGYVNKGCLRNYSIDKKGDEQIIYFATEGWWVGDLQSFSLKIPSMFNVQALEDCELLISSKPEFEAALQTVPGFEKFYRLKTQTAYTNTQRLVVEKSDTAEDRYMRLLESSPSILQRVPQHYLASYLGIKPQSLSRIRKKISSTK